MPVPVDPAMSKCGIWERSETRLRPIRSLPSASVSLEGELTNSADSICSRRAIVCGDAFGTSMPTVDFPGMRSIRMDSALQREAQIVREAGDAAVLDAGLGLEFVSGHHRAGIDLRHVAADVELLALLLDGVRAFLEFVFVDLLAALRVGEQRGRRQLVSGLARRDFWFGGFFFADGSATDSFS